MRFFLILFPSIIFSSINARISLPEDAAASPVLLNFNQDNNDIPFQRFQTFLRRTKRLISAAPIGPPSINASANQLGPETRHNQALIHWSGNYSSLPRLAFSNKKEQCKASTVCDRQVGKWKLHSKTEKVLSLSPGEDNQVIFILTRRKDATAGKVIHSVLWRSSDYGKHYQNESSKFDEHTLLKSYYTCPTNKTKVIFIDSYTAGQPSHSRVWVSTDEGESYNAHVVPFLIDKILFHPSREDWLLGYDNKNKALYSSMDLGTSWTKLHDDVTQDRFNPHPDHFVGSMDKTLYDDYLCLVASNKQQIHWTRIRRNPQEHWITGNSLSSYYWYKKNVDQVEDANKIVYIEYQDYTAFDRPFYYVKSCLIPNCAASFFQEKCDRLGPVEGNSLLVQDNYIFVQKPGALEKLYVSYNREEFVKARFHRSGEQTDIHVISSHSNTVVVGVNHDMGYTHLYFSDRKGRDFSLSLDNVLYFNKKVGNIDVFTVDIHEVKSVKGVYIANKRELQFFNRTMITWDNGRSWHTLKPPASIGSSCHRCTLNLHCAMSSTKSGYYMPNMLSKESAPGLIIAHGSVGKTLVDAPPLVTLFVSNDTGLTWRNTLQARNLFVMADQGSILLAVSMYFVKPVQTLSVSSDHGVTWKEFTFSDTQIMVDGVLTEPGEDTHMFTIFGHENMQRPWKVFSIDVSHVIKKSCVYPDDFRNVTMPFNNSSSCHLGMRRTVETLVNTGCLIGRNFTRKSSQRPCNCTLNDYECDFDYVPYSDGKCSKRYPQIDWIEDIIDYDDIIGHSMLPCINGTRNLTSGYRKIPGDVCVNELKLSQSKTVSCNDTTTTTTTTPTTTTTTTTTTTIAGGFYLRILNYTPAATVNNRLAVAAIDCFWSSTKVDWSVTFLNSSKIVPDKQQNNSFLSIYSRYPGVYQVVATCGEEEDTKLLKFQHPIDRVTIMHPPVVTYRSIFKAYTFVTAAGGLPGISEFLGPVHYTWSYASKIVVGSSSISIDTSSLVFAQILSSQILRVHVGVRNDVSIKTMTTTVHLKDQVVMLNVPLIPSQLLNSSVFSVSWFHDLRSILTHDLLEVDAITKLLTSKNLLHNDFHVYIEPTFPLQGSIYLSTWWVTSTQVTSSQLNQIKTQLNDIIMRENIVMHLPNEQKIYVGHLPTRGGVSVAVIVVIVLLVLAIIVVLLLVIRKYGRARRWKSYFTMRGHHPTLRLSRIVRPREHDLAPIVDPDDEADEFFDDVIEPPLDADSPPDGRLQFRPDSGE